MHKDIFKHRNTHFIKNWKGEWIETGLTYTCENKNDIMKERKPQFEHHRGSV